MDTEAGLFKQLEFYDKLDNVQKSIQSLEFWRIHKSYFINYKYVIEYTYEWVKMKNGIQLPISQINRKEIRNKLLKLKKEKNYGYKVCE